MKAFMFMKVFVFSCFDALQPGFKIDFFLGAGVVGVFSFLEEWANISQWVDVLS